MSKPYVNLHLHTTYSLLDGVIKIPDLMKRLKEIGASSCAITDHGNLHGTIEFYQECKKNNINPILGMESYVSLDPDGAEEKNRDNYHMVLLAKNEEGWHNLIWLSSNAYLNNYYYKPRVSIGALRTHCSGLIATSACLAGFPSRLMRWEPSINKCFIDDYKKYRDNLKWFQEIFDGEYYLEIQDHDFWEQDALNRTLIPFARKEKIPLVITSDAHYLKKEDSAIHELMMAMQFKKTIEEYRQSDQIKYGCDNYVKTSEEMLQSARKYEAEDAYYNTIKIAEQVDLNITFGEYKLPVFPVKEADDYEDFKKWRKERNKQ